MPWPRRGRVTWFAISPLPTVRFIAARTSCAWGIDELLHHRGERQRREPRADALDRRVEVVESLLLDERGDLGAPAHARHGLVGDDAAVRLLHRGDERLLVERLQRPRVEDLDRDPVLLGLLGRRRAPRGRGGPVATTVTSLALAMHARLTELDRLDLLGTSPLIP